jgi:hypothetical protein
MSCHKKCFESVNKPTPKMHDFFEFPLVIYGMK